MIPAEELRVEVVPVHPRGGQYVGTPPQYVKVTHLPTDIVVMVPSHYIRSQHKAKNLAVEMLEWALS